MKYRLLESLLPHLDAYERAYPQQQNPQHFAVWLARQTAEKEHLVNQETSNENGMPEEAAISKHLVFLNRYARGYAKKALEGSVLGSWDEFTYLTVLFEFGSLTKSELIQRNRHEKPTGMEIIRRLLALGLAVQSDDPDDRRSKQLRLTPEGATVLAQTAGRIQLVAQLLTRNLNTAEKLLLLQILEKLENFHQVVLAKTKGGEWQQIARLMTK